VYYFEALCGFLGRCVSRDLFGGAVCYLEALCIIWRRCVLFGGAVCYLEALCVIWRRCVLFGGAVYHEIYCEVLCITIVYGVATISRLLKILVLFFKRIL